MIRSSTSYDELDLRYLEVFEYGKKQSQEKPTLIFIHGFYTDHNCFEPLIDKLSKEYNCITFNNPGSGSENIDYYPKEYLRIEIMAKLIAKYILENNLDNILLIGHSLGGALSAMVFSYVKNVKIKKLMLLSPYAYISTHSLSEKIYQIHLKSLDFYSFQKLLFYDYDAAMEKIGPYYKKKYTDEMVLFDKRNRKYAYYVFKNMFLPYVKRYIFHCYSQIDIPTRLYVAENDVLINSNKTIGKLAQFIKNIKIKEYKKSGHAFFVENLDDMIKEIENFICENNE